MTLHTCMYTFLAFKTESVLPSELRLTQMNLSCCLRVCVLLTQGRYLKARELSALRDTWGGEQAVVEQLRKLLQVASALTFAVRSPSFNMAERVKLAKHARDMVSAPFELHLNPVYVEDGR